MLRRHPIPLLDALHALFFPRLMLVKPAEAVSTTGLSGSAHTHTKSTSETCGAHVKCRKKERVSENRVAKEGNTYTYSCTFVNESLGAVFTQNP